MAKKRGARPARFATLRAFYCNFKAELMTSDSAKANIESTGYVIYESELEKFASEYPDIDIADFTEFVKAHGAHKVAGKKVTGTGARQYNLNTKEKADQLGVTPENQEEYIKLVNLMYQVKAKIQPLIPNGQISFAIPIRQPKAEATT